MTEIPAPVGMQYGDRRHQAETAIAGMWLFLATEVLFFGALLFAWMIYRAWHPSGFAEAACRTDITIGTINTILLLTSSFTFTAGLLAAEAGNMKGFVRGAGAAIGLGLGFIGLKAVEYHNDFTEHLVPGAGFAIAGPDRHGAELFYLFYYTATGVHLAHLAIGIGLVAYLLGRARLGTIGRGRTSPIEVVGLYWSFVDIVWLLLYPLIYLGGRGA